MAKKKITDLAVLTTPASGDYIPIVDVSDLSQAASGTTKKIAYSDVVTTVNKTTLGLATTTTDNAISRYDGTGGNTQNSTAILDDNGRITTAIFSTGNSSVLTISSDAVTATKSYHEIDTEGGAASDNLATINGGSTGDFLIIQSVDGARDVVVKHATGNILLSGSADFTLGSSNNRLFLHHRGGFWFELGRLTS
jgi:hypothetical protein